MLEELQEQFVDLFDILEELENAGLIEKFSVIESDDEEWASCVDGEFEKETGKTITITLFVNED